MTTLTLRASSNSFLRYCFPRCGVVGVEVRNGTNSKRPNQSLKLIRQVAGVALSSLLLEYWDVDGPKGIKRKVLKKSKRVGGAVRSKK